MVGSEDGENAEPASQFTRAQQPLPRKLERKRRGESPVSAFFSSRRSLHFVNAAIPK